MKILQRTLRYLKIIIITMEPVEIWDLNHTERTAYTNRPEMKVNTRRIEIHQILCKLITITKMKTINLLLVTILTLLLHQDQSIIYLLSSKMLSNHNSLEEIPIIMFLNLNYHLVLLLNNLNNSN